MNITAATMIHSMDGTFISYLGAGFLGGIILNVMPCVLPVLTMKIFHVMQQGQESRQEMRAHGLAYTAGIMVMFLGLAAIVIGLRASGELVGWGMQFQNPSFVAALTGLMVVFGLNALGVFEFTISMQGGQSRQGLLSSFVNGIVASLMSTPCSAPFLGTAAAVALGTGAVWWETLSLFVSIGLGLATPFLLVSFIPVISRIIPRPGAWMDTFKQLMGFTLLGAAVWLFGVLQNQITTTGANWFLAFMLVLSILLWATEHFGGLRHGNARRIGVRVGAVALAVLAGWGMIDMKPPKTSSATVASTGDEPVVLGDKINWAGFSSARVSLENKRKRPVFIDYTADWCANCKANEKAFIEVARVRKTLEDTRILPMKADLTNENAEIWEWLGKLGLSAIPAYAIYMPDGSIDLLPIAITTEVLVERLEKASKTYPPAQYLPTTAVSSPEQPHIITTENAR